MPTPQILIEELEEEWVWVPTIAPPEAKNWTLEQINAYFEDGVMPSDAPTATLPPASVASTAIPKVELAGSTDEEMLKWFPKLKSQLDHCGGIRVLCFHNAGSTEDVYTGKTKVYGRPIQSNALMKWAETSKRSQILSAALPGRPGPRADEPHLRTAQEVAATITPVVAHALQASPDSPYAVICHSMGTLCAFETLQLLRAAGLPMPVHLFVSCFPSPDASDVPWQVSAELGDAEFQQELRKWGVNDIVFSPEVWENYKETLRADFTIFDQYKCGHAVEPFSFPITAWWATDDKMVDESHMKGWEKWTTGTFCIQKLSGPHLFHSQADAAREEQFKLIVSQLDPFNC